MFLVLLQIKILFYPPFVLDGQKDSQKQLQTQKIPNQIRNFNRAKIFLGTTINTVMKWPLNVKDRGERKKWGHKYTFETLTQL